MEMSKYIEWLFTYMIFHYGCLAYNIDSEVCLEKPFEFALSRTDCLFTLAKAKDWLISDTGFCTKKCKVKINNLEEWSNYYGVYYPKYYQLTSLALSFNDFGEKVTAIHSRCRTSYEKRTMEIICKTGFENVNISKDLCKSATDCWDTSKTCLPSAEGQIGACICKPGYIGYGKMCLKENLKLNETCQRNEQCSVVLGSVCQNNTCSCRKGYVPFNDSECISLDILRDLCASNKDCKDVSKRCSLTGKFGVCVCKHGFIEFRKKCLKGNLKLNETCKRNEQCFAVFGAICQKNICVCSYGYVPYNDSECFLTHSDCNLQGNLRSQKENNVVNVMFGLSGLMLGVIATVLAVIVNQNIRKGKSKTKEKERTNTAIANNTTFETEMDAIQNIPIVHRTNEEKNVNMQPFARSVKLSRKGNVKEAEKRSMTKNDVSDDIYNHLHEKETYPDIDENYDHAPGNLYHAMRESNYSNLNK